MKLDLLTRWSRQAVCAALLCCVGHTPVHAEVVVTNVANVAAIDRPFYWNRLGAAQPNGMIFALTRDVVSLNPNDRTLSPGEVTLREDKRPRPIVLRVNEGDYLQIHFRNLLDPALKGTNAPPGGWGAATRDVGVHIMGLELGDIGSDGSWVGKNATSLVKPGESRTYTYYAKAEGVFLLYSSAGEGLDQVSSSGLFGSVIVEPRGAEYYRSQVTQADLVLAITSTNAATGLPIINYHAAYSNKTLPDGAPLPVLRMTQTNRNGQVEIVYSDLTAIITGPNAGRFSDTSSPSFRPNPVSPHRAEPYREFSIHYHSAQTPGISGFGGMLPFHSPATLYAFAAGADAFAINYGTGAIGPEVVANRLGVGPMGNPDAVDLKFEEFFLSSWANGDPSIITDVPANAPDQILAETNHWAVNVPLMNKEREGQGFRLGTPDAGPAMQATKALYPDDPSNVYHSYMNDHVKFRVLNTGIGQTHVHHLHAHQWLHSPNSDDGAYLDSQMITPGSAYTEEIVHGGSGNQNRTVGDSIFHCHFYVHFAQGMWALWRVHDVFEGGTYLDANGVPRTDIPNRALPDGEIAAGTPIPAVVPLPTLAMAPAPALVTLTNLPPNIGRTRGTNSTGFGRRVAVLEPGKNPGFPFYIPGVAGHRAPHPPLDFAWKENSDGTPVLHNGSRVYLDGGLPRHLLLDGRVYNEFHTRWDLSKDFVLARPKGSANLVDGFLKGFQLPEEGTPAEKVAMAAHATRTHASITPSGQTANFLLNGSPPTNGAPFADPAPFGTTNYVTRRYKAAAIQTDVVINKAGWHFPQQRFLSLWGDVSNVVSGAKAPEPFFFRANSGEVVEYWHCNLVPNYYELDDFQVRTPTDILGQHIHLVKFDVTASDGAANGFNYEDGTFSPDEVREQIFALNKAGGLFGFDPATQFIDTSSQTMLATKPASDVFSGFGQPPGGQHWDGAQVTIQRWYADPQLNNDGFDRTLRTVFTHDHFGPSTHQQAGFYAGLLIEPTNSVWMLSEADTQMYQRWPGNTGKTTDSNAREDGGPTSWQARIITPNPAESYREFALEFQDLALSYLPTSPSAPDPRAPSSPLFVLENASSLVGPLSRLNKQPVESNTNLPVSLRAQFAENGIILSKNAYSESAGPLTYIISDPHDPQYEDKRDYDQYKLVISNPAPLKQKATLQVMLVNTTPAGWSSPENAINPNGTDPFHSSDPASPPYPTLISQSQAGTYSVNYRNEPIPLRVNNSGFDLSNTISGKASLVLALSRLRNNPPDSNTNLPASLRTQFAQHGYPLSAKAYSQLNGISGYFITDPAGPGLPAGSGFHTYYRIDINNPDPLHHAATLQVSPIRLTPGDDLGYAFGSVDRSDTNLNWQPLAAPIDPDQTNGFHYPRVPLTPGMEPTDPFTPLLRAYANDRVQVRTLVGAHLMEHAFQIQGVKWLFEPTYTNSGYRNVQGMGISEHFEMLFDLPSAGSLAGPGFADYLYTPSSEQLGLENGDWGLIRAYSSVTNNLKTLPNNPTPANGTRIDYEALYNAAAPAHQKAYTVVAITAEEALSSGNTPGAIVYNPTTVAGYTTVDPNGIFYARISDLDTNGSNWKLTNGVLEPLILRAAAGDWVKVTVINHLKPLSKALTTPFPSQLPGDLAAPMFASSRVGLNANLVSSDIAAGNGINAGFNPDQTVGYGDAQTSYWYAGNLSVSSGTLRQTPMEFGTCNLVACDPVLQLALGLVGALIIEPVGASWDDRLPPRAGITVTNRIGTFREFVALGQANIPANGGLSAFNYRSEPRNARYSEIAAPPAPAPDSPDGYAQQFSDSITNTIRQKPLEPYTPIFYANAGDSVRFRVLSPGGALSQVFTLNGHVWQEEPYASPYGQQQLGFNPLSQWVGSQQINSSQPFDLLLDSAGGLHKVPGDYLYHLYLLEDAGLWGVLRVLNPGEETPNPPVKLNPASPPQATPLQAAARLATATRPVNHQLNSALDDTVELLRKAEARREEARRR